MFRNILPKCSECIHYVNGGVSKTYDLGTCSKFMFNGQHYFAEMARLEPTKCGVEAVHFKPCADKLQKD